eukprot:753024-Hanusia_phi.AAC.2
MQAKNWSLRSLILLLWALSAGSCFVLNDGISERNFRFNNFVALPAASGHSPFYSDSDLSDLLVRLTSRFTSTRMELERSENNKLSGNRHDSCAYPSENRNVLGSKMLIPPIGLLRPSTLAKPFMK